jgi:hypothetical protein
VIKVVEEGTYKLIETKHLTKILKLKRNNFAWISAGEIGEILISSHKPHRIDHVLAKGRYRMYEVVDEKDFTDLIHLELHIGNGSWQGYLLPKGLPNGIKRRKIIPTREVITKSLD